MRRLVLTVVCLAFQQDAAAIELMRPQSSIFIFGGEFRTGTFPGWTMIPFTKGREDNYVVGGAYDVQYVKVGWGVTLGMEVGLAGRFGKHERSSAEIWGGVSIRHEGISIADVIIISPGLVFGFSGVTAAIGQERLREVWNNADSAFLFYLGPEVSLRFTRSPNIEFVTRTHHRSGAKGTLGNMGEGHNANTFGIRVRY